MKVEIDRKSGMSILKRLFCFSGRARRKEFWLTALGLAVFELAVLIVMGILTYIKLDFIAVPLAILLTIAVAVAGVANTFRRIHDLGLSGFWLCYLSFFGLPFLYIAYIMDADESAKQVISRIKDVGTPWLGWILAALFWPLGAGFGMLIILLSPGQQADNKYGPNPYVTQPQIETAAA